MSNEELILHELKEIRQAQEILSHDVSKVKLALFGDAELQQGGVIKDMAYVKNWITERNIKTAWIAGATTFVVILIKGGWDLLLSNIHK